ncbi:hypothetical protein NKH18_00850 [Streptomyces sp. M10(2022)]
MIYLVDGNNFEVDSNDLKVDGNNLKVDGTGRLVGLPALEFTGGRVHVGKCPDGEFDDWVMDGTGERFAVTESDTVAIIDQKCNRIETLLAGESDVAAVALNFGGTMVASNSDGVTRLRSLRSITD